VQVICSRLLPYIIVDRFTEAQEAKMGAGYKPNILKILEVMDAEEMLSDVFVYSESDAAAGAYEYLVNGTIQQVQELCGFGNDLTLSTKDARIQYTVYWHLGLLCDHLTKGEQKSQWVEERDRCLREWGCLVKSKGYPITFTDKFKECGESEKDQVQTFLEEEFEDNGSEPPPTVAWHLRFLCDSLPEGPEKSIWKSKLSNYLESISEQQRIDADDYAQRVKEFIKKFNDLERVDDSGRRLSPDEYYKKVVPQDEWINRNANQTRIVGRAVNFFNNQR
jgi:hypothetical protein